MAKEMEEVVVRARRPGFSSNAPRGGGGGISGSGFNTSNYFGGDPSFLSSEALLEDFDPTPDFSDRRRLRDRIADRVNQARENYPIATKAIELAAGSTALGQAVGGINLAKKVVNKMQDKEKKAMGGMMYNKGSLVGNQSLLDKNNDGDITGEDFKMLREKKIFGGLLRLSSAGAKKAGKLLLNDATKDIKKISKDLPSASQQKSIKDQYSIRQDQKDQGFEDAAKEEILAQQIENKYHIQTLEDFFSGEPKLEKAIKQLRKQIYSKVKDKDVADDIYAARLLELELKYAKRYKQITNDSSTEFLERQEQMADFEMPKSLLAAERRAIQDYELELGEVDDITARAMDEETYFIDTPEQRLGRSLSPQTLRKRDLDPRFEEFGAFKEDLEPLTETQKRLAFQTGPLGEYKVYK